MSTGSQPDNEARALITNSVYHVRCVRANSGLFDAKVERMLQGTTVKYPLNRIKTQAKAIERGTVYKQIIIEQNTQHSSRVIVELVKVAAVTGDFALNSFKFARYGLNCIEPQLGVIGDSILSS